MNESLKTSIKSLPPLPESVIKIQQICNDPDSGIQELIKVVEKDPMLTANLLKAANSPLYGFSREINNVGQAVSLFGMATVKGFALASAVRSNLKVDLSPYGISAEFFATQSQFQSALMLKWYQRVDRTKMNILAPASFLIGIGHVVIAMEVVKMNKTEEFLKKIKSGESIRKVEESLFQTNAQEVAAEVFDHWRFEPAMIDSIRSCNHPKESDDSVKDYAYALNIIQTAVPLINTINEESIKKALLVVKEAGLNEELFSKSVKELTE